MTNIKSQSVLRKDISFSTQFHSILLSRLKHSIIAQIKLSLVDYLKGNQRWKKQIYFLTINIYKYIHYFTQNIISVYTYAQADYYAIILIPTYQITVVTPKQVFHSLSVPPLVVKSNSPNSSK